MEITEIKSRLTIYQVLEHYGLKVNQSHMLCCPFHEDKTPSLQIYPLTNTFCCFSSNCKAGTGDVIDFIQLQEKSSKHEAIVKAKSLIGAISTTPESKLVSEGDRVALLTKAFSFFTNAQQPTKGSLDYIESRTIKGVEAGFPPCEVLSTSQHVDVGMKPPCNARMHQNKAMMPPNKGIRPQRKAKTHRY